VDDETKGKMIEAIYNDNIEYNLVIGENTKVSDGRLEKYGFDHVVQMNPADLSSVKVDPERARP
jgi:hypothetical protein